MKISVIIPVFNEFKTVGIIINKILKLKDLDIQIILVDDFSTDGTKLGLGLKKETGFGFVKLEYSETDYDTISTTTSNNTKVTADIDTEVLALSVAKSF